MDNTTKILIADENQTSRQTIADGLRRAGFGAIYEASNGEEALELISRLHPAVALVAFKARRHRRVARCAQHEL